MSCKLEDQSKKWKQKRTWKKQVEEENMNGGVKREDVICCWC